MAPSIVPCCIANCSSTSRTHNLYNMPKDDKLRALWLSFLIPMNSELKNLSKEQLKNKRVCQIHFDRYQFDDRGKRIAGGYPCLFTAKEIEHRIPLDFSGVYPNDEHNYATKKDPVPDPEPEIIPIPTVVSDCDHIYSRKLKSSKNFLCTAAGIILLV